MQIVLTVLAIAGALCAGGCADLPRQSDATTGTIADVYVETAPGLFLERNLAAHRAGLTVAVVNLADMHRNGDLKTVAWVPSGTAVARGDIVRLRLTPESGRAHDGVVPTGDRVVDVVPANNTPVAAIAINGL